MAKNAGSGDQPAVQQIAVKVGTANLSDELMDVLLYAEVESSMGLPDMVIMRFLDDDLKWMDDATFEPGKALEVEFGDADDNLVNVFKGEITAIEPEFTPDASATLTIRGYDKRHRLNRGSNVQAFVNQKDSDVVSTITSSSGLSATATATSTVHEHFFQSNATNLSFLNALANTNGYEVSVEGTSLKFRPPKGDRGELTLQWQNNRGLRSFRPRLSVAEQVDEVTVRGWDPKKKEAIIGSAKSSTTHPSINVGGSGGAVAKSKIAAASQVVVDRPVVSQKEAEAVAQGILDSINARFVQADGVAYGNPNLLAGMKVKLEKLGNRFSGTYVVTAARHIYQRGEVYETEFSVAGTRPELMSDLVNGHGSYADAGVDNRNYGVTVGVVTNNLDPDNMGRVKLKFPALMGDVESCWARLASPGAGKERGMQFVPEVNDEVLVAFEHGHIDYPYVIGGLWNGKEKTPQQPPSDNGKVEQRIIKTREGHLIRFNDKSGEQKIEIIDAQTNTSIILDTQNKTIKIDSKDKITVTATGDISVEGQNVTVKAKGNMNLEATGNMTIKGAAVTMEATGALSVKGKVGTVEASTAMAVKGNPLALN
jgi:uncharacterized protein involved in type VI secretion and phage assembly